MFKKGKENIVADALSRRYVLPNTLSCKLLVFDLLKESYVEDKDFGQIYEAFQKKRVDRFYKGDGFLFRENKHCTPLCSTRELLVHEAHSGSLMGHFGNAKTYDILDEQFYWPKMMHDMYEIVNSCIICRRDKSRVCPMVH